MRTSGFIDSRPVLLGAIEIVTLVGVQGAKWKKRQQAGDGPAERWVALDDVAEHLGVARHSVYRWIETRALHAHRIGGLWKFKFSEVELLGAGRRG